MLHDCNGNGVYDPIDLAIGHALDCNGNGAIDFCEIQADPSLDLDGSGVLDSCESGGRNWFRSPLTGRLLTVLAPTTWANARAQAEGLESSLITVRNAAENAWLVGFLPGDTFWIGYHDSVLEGSFEWHSGEGPGYENWAPGAPGDFTPNQDFVAMRPSDGTWDTWFGDSTWRAVVESTAVDCDANLVPDDLQISDDPSLDCDGNGLIDFCEIFDSPGLDCNGNMWLDSCEILAPLLDCDGNGLVDECEINDDPDFDCNLNGILDLCEILPPELDLNGDGLFDACVAPNYCAGMPNSAGAGGDITAFGSPEIALGDLTLHATGLPGLQWSYFLMSQSQANVTNFGGSQGTLCLGSPIVRFVMMGTGQVDQTAAGGERIYPLDFSNLPQATVFLPGETWNFQLWFRDVNPAVTSNTTNGLTVMFR